MIGQRAITYERRGDFTSALHAERFDHPVLADDWDWRAQVERHSLRAFYFDACGFVPTNAGLIEL